MSFRVEDLIQEDIKYLTKLLKEDGDEINAKMDELLFNFEQYIKTGDTVFLQNELCKHSNINENSEPVIPLKKRQKKGVLVDITAPNVPVAVENVKIKVEKISNVFPASKVTSLRAGCEYSNESGSNSTVNSNNEEEMPPPKQLPLRKRKIKEEPLDMPKRTTRTRKKPIRYTANEEVIGGKLSDIVIQNADITTIDVTNESDKQIDSGEAVTQQESTTEEGKQEVEPIRSKRTRTIKKMKLESAESQNDNLPIKQNDKVYIVEKEKTQSPGNENTTFILKPDCIETNSPKTPQKPKKKKEIFSPFDKVSTKEKVKAFEKFNALSKTAPVSPPSVRTRANKIAKEKDEKTITPIASKLPSKVHSTTKASKFIHRDGSSSSNNSLLASKSHSSLKASQAEFRERVKKQKEKEEEALKKREAIMLALSEEKKKKREEKQIKAQQQREILEKEKLKQIEAQKLKDEKYKQAVAEREENLQKQKEDERKLLVSKKRADQLQIRVGNGLKPNLPLYMTTEAPLLPTDDCYDSDDEESERGPPKKMPAWSSNYELKKQQIVLLRIGEQIKNTFFSRQVHTPDLQEIFERIDPRKLKRTSSAIWRKPPRYTFFLETSTVQFSEDDE